MKKKTIGFLVCTLLITATVLPVAGNLKIKSTQPIYAIDTSVDLISPYNQPSWPITITATGPSDLDSVTLYYRWSVDNVSWSGMQEYTVFDGFESGSQNTDIWNTHQGGNGDPRIQFDYGSSHSGSYSCAMDDYDQSTGNNGLNVLYTNIDFTDADRISVNFWQREWGDEAHNAQENWTGWRNYDVVAFTNDFVTWHRLFTEGELNEETFTEYYYDISTHPEFISPATSNFAIAFQQYDNVRLTQDGRAWDDIRFNYSMGNPGCNWKLWDISANPDTSYPWEWPFYFPNETGYYEFYSIGKKTGEPDETPPLVADARCRFNRKPEIYNEYPSSGSTNIPLEPELQVSIKDVDSDTMSMNWYSNSTGSWKNFGSNLSIEDGRYRQTNSNFSEYDTTYWWYVSVNDGVYTNSSPYYYFTTRVNNPPNTPSNPDPANGETGLYIGTDLSWTCIDPDGDNVSFDVYFGKSSSPPKVASKQPEKTYDPGLLDFGTKYYWRIVAWDSPGGLSTNGPLWSFTTEENQPPNTPSNPDPPDGATDISVEKLLRWTGGDPNQGDVVVYDVYFGTSSPPPKVADNIAMSTYDPGTMELGTTYYWQIVSEDSEGLTTDGPIWSFITELEPNAPPSAPDIYGPPIGPPGVELCWAFVSYDQDENDIKYLIDWGDGDSIKTDFYPNGRAAEACHTYEGEGTYTIKAIAEDEKGLQSRESSFKINVRKSRTAYHPLLLRLLERFPILEKLLSLVR